ncbi:aminotransferase class III-fold pyridoxal phosphate-dependent enzyme [Streptacidiphilus sp. PB12-B1b]|uniref:aminotransferase class III-fold pyridoxal phosphate-dependent enzyme n=1 Tax=Streptacidiphilus sp. PB12-B1b TaxID=2705012 RepID=UPI0015F8D901|nr:aminotransferase class III-fold pyridoxal phosphate-dependent enzyme [Streptacidiphilus sp. PB12-B1b]QMU78217.1 aminotransferase class III-fold pyridoxal phosphate-dependent enzyme [Streptacidiphilus sp. PB12-B1b]
MPEPVAVPASATIDVTTTSVGRDTALRTFTSFFEHVTFSGSFRVLVTVDPAYAVSPEERARTLAFLRDLRAADPRVAEVVLEEFPRQVGLPAALGVLLSHLASPVGVHLEDDWEFTGPIDLDGLIEDLHACEATEIVLGNSHTARGGTFERPGEAAGVTGTRVPLVRLDRSSWAAHYLPLSPHVHLTRRWAPVVARALATTDPGLCVDERIREQVFAEGGYDRHRVHWTRAVVAHDIGRAWLAGRGQHRSLTPEHLRAVPGAEALPTARTAPLDLRRSAELRRRAELVTPGLTHTFQKRPENFADGHYPVYLERGSGALVRDVDGQDYVDFVSALGAATLGYNHPVVTNTVKERASRGLVLSLPTPAEVTAAELLAGTVPGVEMVRFLKTGAEAVAAAVRLARLRTGRDEVLLAGYHGWHDQLIGASPGVPQSLLPLSRRVELHTEQDDARLLADVAAAGGRLACVVLSTPYHRRLTAGFLTALRDACHGSGALLVLDEVVTGFRLAPGGLGHHLGVQGDLVCFSKGLAAGAPLAAVAGPRRIMADFAQLRVSSTFAGETVSLEVMKAALRHYAASDYYPRIARLGERLREGLNRAAEQAGRGPVAVGYDPMPCLRFSADPAEHARSAEAFLAGMARRGVLLRRDVNFLTDAHRDEHVDFALAAAAEVLATGQFRAAAARPGGAAATGPRS